MKAVRIHRFGDSSVQEVDEIERVRPSGDQLLIKVKADSVNPVDYTIRKGGNPIVPEDKLPITLGRDVAGLVETAAGGFVAGDEVYAHLDWLCPPGLGRSWLCRIRRGGAGGRRQETQEPGHDPRRSRAAGGHHRLARPVPARRPKGRLEGADP